MTRVAILGAGSGGLSAAVELTQAGHDIALWNRNDNDSANQRPAREWCGSKVSWATGSHTLAAVTDDLSAAVGGAEVLVVCLPSIAHRRLFDDLARLGISQPIVLNPGHTGAALEARQSWRRAQAPMPPRRGVLDAHLRCSRLRRRGANDWSGRGGSHGRTAGRRTGGRRRTGSVPLCPARSRRAGVQPLQRQPGVAPSRCRPRARRGQRRRAVTSPFTGTR